MVAFCHGKLSNCLACYRHDSCVKLRNRFESKGFAEFWFRVEREWAEAEKQSLFYPFDGVNDPDFEGDNDEEDPIW